MVEGTCLESKRRRNPTASSNLALSAKIGNRNMKRILITTAIGISAFILLVIILINIPVGYGYGIDTSKYPQDCASFFNSGERYDYSTVLWTAEGDCKRPINGSWWTPFYVYTRHVSIDDDKAVFSLKVERNSNYDSSKNYSLLEDSISIKLTSDSGVIISPIETKFSKDNYGFVYKQYYPNNLPQQLTESISFTIAIGDQMVPVQKIFNREYGVTARLSDQ